MLTPNLRMIKVLVWDLDGTLFVSPEAAHLMKQTFINMVAKQRGLSTRKAEGIFSLKTKNLNWSRATSRLTGQPERKVLEGLENTIDRSIHIKRELKVVGILKKLGRFRHIVLTNASHENTISTLRLLGFAGEGKGKVSPFEKIFSLDSVKSYKPRAKMFKQVVNYTHLPPNSHLMIGDSLTTDILPAKKLNFQTCLVGGYKTEADYCLGSIYDIPRLFSFYYQLRQSLKSFIKWLPINM